MGRKIRVSAFSQSISERLSFLIKRNHTFELASYLNCSPVAVRQYKAGTSRPSLENLCKIADWYHVSTDYILGMTDCPTPQGGETSGLQEYSPTPCPCCVSADSDADIERALYEKQEKTFWGKQVVYVTICHRSIDVQAGDNTIADFKINFCPICGRKLRGKKEDTQK